MNRETTRIDLPPPREIRPRGNRVSPWVWVALVVVSLVIGISGGIFFGARSGGPSEEEVHKAGVQKEVARKVADARSAVAEGDWFEARRLFVEVRDLDPKNPDALASLPLIDRRLDEARGVIEVETVPEGAEVWMEGYGKKTSPATFVGVPFGEQTLTIRKKGFEPVVRKVEVKTEEPIKVADIKLARSAGRLEVVSEPEGAEFKLLKTIDKEVKELVEIGKTPAKIELLDAGEYQVLMAVEGWPEYSEYVRVENNRNSSVSAVFAKGGLNVTSDPVGAEVWIQTGEANLKKVGVTPLSLSELPVGKHKLEVRYDTWAPIQRTVEIADGVTQDLNFSWERALVVFDSDPVGAKVYLGDRRLGNGVQATPFRMELPEGEYLFSAQLDELGSTGKSVYVDAGAGTNQVVFEFDYGTVRLESEPPGASVVSNGMPLGRTPLVLPVVPPGNYSYTISKEQYRPSEVSGLLEPGGALNFSTTLKYDPAPVTSRTFTNGLGQELIWIGELNGWVASHETTQAAYERIMGSNPSYFKAPNHPVDSVNWYEAVQFCERLTVQEQGLGNLPEGFRYRLPKDAEWSKFVGQQKLDGAISSLFERRKSHAPVGSLAANEFGLYDVRGNVWEWMNDWYSHTIVSRVQKEGGTPNSSWVGTEKKVLRGGAWTRSSQFDLAVANRSAARPSAEDRYDVGFRIVLMRD
ncbi:MAG: hypothetical protein CMO55_13665 [Verrucomicrobiales bacterium]|nr:hypothetical protein [Verrucomicrobiales bacterium]